jgi:hypothetical protein
LANPLEPGMVSPPPPQPDAGRGSDFNALTQGGNALMQRPQQRMPAPSHSQTVAALKHFMMIIDELQKLEKNDALGKSDVHGLIIDGVTGLVGERVLSAPNAVSLLAGVPDDPLQQRKWVKQMMAQTIQAQNNVLAHHAMSHPGTLDWNIEKQHSPYNADDHMQTMEGLGAHYR